MIREDRFLISKRPYAVDLGSMKVKTREPTPYGPNNEHMTFRTHGVKIDAVWFRRRSGVTVACVGYLWATMRDPSPFDSPEALSRMIDGRYGGDCEGRWDGELYWGAQAPAEIERHLALLRPMLENFPDIPAGYDGWYRYETYKERAAR